MNILSIIDKTWTLFLDRDGVMNYEKEGGYIQNWNEFKFYEGVTEAIRLLSPIFGTIVMVTNQRGIGKGLMTDDDLSFIHSNMLQIIKDAQGRIDKIYYCSNIDNECFDRKPNPGMAHQAQRDFPAINFEKSIMVGNKLSDMQFGRNAGMYTVYLDTTHPEVTDPGTLIDYRYNDLISFAHHVHTLVTKS